MTDKKVKKSAKLFSGLRVYITEDDQALMALTQQGETKAFEKLYMKYQNKIYSYMSFFISDQRKAEDLCQDVFMKVYKNKDKYTDEYAFSTWIYRIARNTAIDYLRKKKDVQDPVSETGESLIDNTADENADVELIVSAKAEREIVYKCLESLTDDQKESLSLRLFSEESYEQIAKIQDRSLSAVKSIINRAKKALEECVKDCLEATC